MKELKMTKYGIFSWFSYALPIKERLQIIKQAGFDATSLWWAEDDKHLNPDMARNIGLEIDNIHAPFYDANDLWIDNQNGTDYQNLLTSCIDDCALHNVSVLVVHITGFSNPPEITKTGFDRVKRLVDHAEKKDVYLAFENLRFLQHLDHIFKNIKSDHLGFCYDSGHENCYHPEADCLTRYGHRLFALHIDDNYGDDDTHLLPYDGTVDWNRFKEKLNACKGVKFKTLEVDFDQKHEKGKIYKKLSAKDYLILAYERVLKIG